MGHAKDSSENVEAKSPRNELISGFVGNRLCLFSCVHISFDKELCPQINNHC